MNDQPSSLTTGAATAAIAGSDAKVTPGNRAVLKTLKDLNVKKARAEHHRVLLTTALTEGKTIGGLRRDVRPQIPEVPVDLAIEWENAHLTFTDTLTRLLAKYWTDRREIIDTEIKDTTHKLAVDTSDIETALINSLSTLTFDQEVIKLAAPKQQRAPKTTWPKAKRKRGDATSDQGTNIRQ
jgi:hypothetical protein